MALIAVVAIFVLVLANVFSTGSPASSAGREPTTPGTHHRDDASPGAGRASAPKSYGVGVMTLHLIDSTRTITLPGGQVVPRPVTTVVRYPTLATGAGGAVGGRQPARADGPFPLIIFGHGFDLMPGAYSRLLRYWVSAGFVVATPIFPLENPEAPGGPNESDLPNQPQDMRFVISSLLRLDAQPGGRLSGLIDTHQIAVAGHSDGGDTALALAYDPSLQDPHLQAAVILSGAEIPMLSPFQIAPGGAPLLATQGTADKINLPSATAAFFGPAPSPKYLLQLLGGSHLGPYSTNRVQLGVVERVTTAFLKYYLDHDRAAMRNLLSAGRVSGVARLQADH
jgi:dienelactone hydrolase